MTSIQWKESIENVTDAMLSYTRHFVTPLGTATATSVRLVGTGSFVQDGGRRVLLTCEHVAREQPMHYRFHGSDDIWEHPGPWTMEQHPIDVAVAPISDTAWNACQHRGATIPYSKFAKIHTLADKAELLFFRGYAGENAHYAFRVHQTNGSGYCTQQKEGTGDAQLFELFWEPEHTQFTSGASAEALEEMKFQNPCGFSGSLVWNTRYLEVSRQDRKWSPEDAVVTGLLRRWDPDTRTLLVWRAEHLRAWLDSKAR